MPRSTKNRIPRHKALQGVTLTIEAHFMQKKFTPISGGYGRGRPPNLGFFNFRWRNVVLAITFITYSSKLPGRRGAAG